MSKFNSTIIETNKGFVLAYNHDDKRIYRSRLKSSLYSKNLRLLCGDRVIIERIEAAEEIEGYVMDIQERENYFIRPNISNIDLCLLLVSFTSPNFSHFFVSKALLLLHKQQIPYQLILTKNDLIDANTKNRILNVYTKEGINVTAISHGIYDKISFRKRQNIFVIGRSGVGKTTLINYLTKNTFLTQQISKKSNRGKHTTTALSGKIIENSILFDTPGFEKISVQGFVQQEIAKFFFTKQMLKKLNCSFNTCTHLNENYCNLIKLLKANVVAKERFEIYKRLFKEAKKTYW